MRVSEAPRNSLGRLRLRNLAASATGSILAFRRPRSPANVSHIAMVLLEEA